MSDKKENDRIDEDLMEKAKIELSKMVDDMTELAKEVKNNFKSNPSKNSGSVIQIHEESPYLDENLPDKGWNRVLKGGIPSVPKFQKK